MESDISLLQVAGEDDSLLQQIPEDDLLNLDKDTDGITAGNSGFFLCSPLLTDRSNGANAGSSTAPSTDYADKENMNANNLEVPKLSILPQQTKRKKGGGYNLRKSIAWNRAFFTEEGVLNSLELSMITGSTSTSCGEALTAIEEEIPAIPGGGCSNDLSLQDKLSKDTSASTPSGNRKSGRCLLPKRGSSTKDNVKLKEPSARDVNRSGSKRGGCPRLAASSSVKRPTTSNATKTVNKDERISRIPVPKRDPTVISRTPRKATIRASDAKSNQVAQRVGSNPKKAMLKGSSINPKSSFNKDGNASKSLKPKTSNQQPRRKLASPVLKMNSSHLQHESTDSSGGLKPATGSSISKFIPLNDDSTRKVSVLITQNAPPDGGNVLNQTKMAKPSGLRMPSPSMGFFGQKKVSSFQSLPPTTFEMHDLSKSNTPNVRRDVSSNPTCQLATVPRNFVKARNGEASGETKGVSCVSTGSSVEPVFHDRAKSISEAASIHLGKVNVVDDFTMNKDLNAQGLEKPDMLSHSNLVLQHLGDVSKIHDEINDQLAECKPGNVSFNYFGDSTKSFLGETNDLGTLGTPGVLNDQLSGAQDCNEQSSEEVEFTNSSNCMLKRSSSDHLRLGIGTRNSLKRSRTSKDFEHVRYEENVGNDSHGQECCAFDNDMNEVQNEASETHYMGILQTKKAEASDTEHCISNECNSTMESASALSNSDSMHIESLDSDMNAGQDEASETHKMRILQTKEAEASDTEHCISNECNSTMKGASVYSNSDSMHIDDEKPEVSILNRKSLRGRDFSLTSQHDSYTNEVLAGGSDEVCKNKVENIIDLCLIPRSQSDACLDSGPVVSNCNYHADEMVDVRSDIQQNNTSLEMERNQDDHGDVAIAYDTDAAEILPRTRDLGSSDTGNQLSEHVPNEDKENSQVLSSVNDFNPLPGLAELQNCCMDLVTISPNNNHQGKCSNADLLQTSNSEEFKEEINTDGVIGSSDVCTSECLNNYKQMASPKDYRNLHEEAHDTRTGDNVLESQGIEVSVRSSECSAAKSSKYGKVLSGEGASEAMSKEMASEARTSCNDSSSCSLGSSVPNDHILSRENVQQSVETKELADHESSQMNGIIVRQNENELNCEMEHLPDAEMCSTYDKNAQSVQLRESEDVRKQNGLAIKTSTNVVPFSEEWLAAIEAAGEEILTMKSGAVQNSPPDKSQPEPSPWSPVKRKNNQGIGPFDCTKCTQTSQLPEPC